MFRKVKTAIAAVIFFGVFGTLTVSHSQAGGTGKPALKAEKAEVTETEEQKRTIKDMERETGNVRENLERIGRQQPDFAPAPEAKTSLLGPSAPRPKSGAGARSNKEIAEKAGIAFQEIASVDLSAGVASPDAKIRENAYVIAGFLQSHDIAVQLAIARALMMEHVKSARRAAAQAILDINPIDPKVLSLIREAALESLDMDVRMAALNVLHGSYHFEVVAHELALRFKSRKRRVRAPVVDLYRTIRSRNLDELLSDLTRTIPYDLLAKFLP